MQGKGGGWSDGLRDGAEWAVRGGGDAEAVKVRVKSDMPCVKLGKDAALGSGQVLISTFSGWQGGEWRGSTRGYQDLNPLIGRVPKHA
jgi:hypothetical protein